MPVLPACMPESWLSSMLSADANPIRQMSILHVCRQGVCCTRHCGRVRRLGAVCLQEQHRAKQGVRLKLPAVPELIQVVRHCSKDATNLRMSMKRAIPQSATSDKAHNSARGLHIIEISVCIGMTQMLLKVFHPAPCRKAKGRHLSHAVATVKSWKSSACDSMLQSNAEVVILELRRQ